jgi:hypothetical protein
MKTQKKTTAGRKTEAASPGTVDHAAPLRLWFRCDGENCALDGARSDMSEEAENYRNHVQNVIATAYDKSDKGFKGEVFCQLLVSYSEKTFPSDELTKLKQCLGEGIKQYFTSCKASVRLITPLQGTNLIQVLLYPEGRGEDLLKTILTTPLTKPHTEDKTDAQYVRTQPKQEAAATDDMEDLTLPKVQPRKSSRERPPLVPEGIDLRIAGAETEIARQQREAAKRLQGILDDIAGKSADDYDTNRQLVDRVNQDIRDCGLVLLHEGTPVLLMLTKPPPKTRAGYFELRDSETTKQDMGHGNAWPLLTVVTAADWRKQNEQAGTKKVKTASA